MSDYPHTPGSDAAVEDGCTCPVLDNAHGKGCGYTTQDGERLFIVNGECPLHGGKGFLPDDTHCLRDISEPAYGVAARKAEGAK